MWFFDVLPLWILLTGVLTVSYWYIRNQFAFWEKRGVSFKKPHWLFGNFGDFIISKTSLAELSCDIYNEYKTEQFVGIWQFFTPILFLVDPTLIRDVMVKDFSTWACRGVNINQDVDPLAAHLVNLDGKKWKSVRAKLTPTFTSGKLKQMHYLLLECGNEFERHLNTVVATGGLVEAREMSARFTTDVIGSCAFGIQMNSLSDEGSLFRNMGRKIFETSLRGKIVRALQTSFTPLFRLLKLKLISQELTDFFLKTTKQTIDYRENNNIQRHDFVDLLRNLKNTGKPLDKDEVEFTDEILAAQAFVFFAAGFETSSTAISYCLHELAVNEDIQNRLREEVHKTKAANNGEITWDGLKNMKYLDMVVQEILRKYPPIPMVLRTSTEPYRISGTNVELPTGSQCIIPIYALHHDPAYYPDPEKFDPERFTEEAKSQRPGYVFLPFGGGPRVCIGLRFAEQQTKMALVKLVDNFKVSLCEKSQNPLRLDPSSRFLVPEVGIWVCISRISSN